MNVREKIVVRVVALSFSVLLQCASVFSQSIDVSAGAGFAEASQKTQFIAAFEWSVDKRKEYVWPFESIRPAPYESVRMLVDQMPRAWSEKGESQASVQLYAYQCLRVNGNKLPKRSPGQHEEFRVFLDRGRLRLSFSLPPGLKLDQNYTTIRIRLYQVD